MIKGVIFDYNGTIFSDVDLNYEAWKIMYKDIVGNIEGYDEIYNYYGSTNNTLFLQELYRISNKEYDLDLLNKQSFDKETIYHNICIEKNRHELAKGCDEFIKYLLDKGLKINLCTASIMYNVDFYFKNCNLDKYFDKSLVAYDYNNNTDKEELYKIACKNIGLDPSECLSVDDSVNSINDAIRAGIKNVIRINYTGKPKMDNKEIICEVKDFTEIDISKLNQILL